MFKKLLSVLVAAATILSIAVLPQKTANAASGQVMYKTHVQSYGWQDWVSDGATSGTVGQSKRLEAIYIKLDSSIDGGISYQTHVQNIGWQGWVSNGALSGTSGRSLRLEAIRIKLTGNAANNYDIYYRVHAQNFGWLDWASNGASAGTAGYSYRLEGIQIVLVTKGGDAPGATDNPFYDGMIKYQTHVQNVGWQGVVADGKTSGTSGKSLRLEGIKITLGNTGYSGTVSYRTHVQNIGWQDWVSNGAMSGTSGKSLRLEAIQIKLSGDVASHYDIYYRVHAQNYGWLDWAKNGASAGTAGCSYRLEAIQIVLLPKGTIKDGMETTSPFVQACSSQEAAMLLQVNKARKANGLAYLQGDETLHAAAQKRATEITNYFSHTRPNGTSCSTVLSEYGISYSACGENILVGTSSASYAHSLWMSSDGHRSNILNSSYTKVGIGYVNGYWVEVFIR